MILDIKRLIENAKKATQGPWGYDHCGDVYSMVVLEDNKEIVEAFDGDTPYKTVGGTAVFITGNPDAVHIAGCDPPTIIALCNELQYLRAEVELLKEN